jgi:galactokinase
LLSARYQALLDKFEQTYHRKPDFIARSPGRVNLIGEHIDYCGFGVLPMAVDRDVVMAVATTNDDTKVRVANVNPKYPTREFDYEGVEKIVTIDSSSLEWSNYFKCGYKVGILTRWIYRMWGKLKASSDHGLSFHRVCSSVLN